MTERLSNEELSARIDSAVRRLYATSDLEHATDATLLRELQKRRESDLSTEEVATLRSMMAHVASYMTGPEQAIMTKIFKQHGVEWP